MGRMVKHKIKAILFCLILNSCVSNYFLHIQTYPSEIQENGIGYFDLHFRRFRYEKFWNEINFDIKNELLIYKDSVKLSHKGNKGNVSFLYDENRNSEIEKIIKLTEKGVLHFRFHTRYPMMVGDSIMLHTKNAIFTPFHVIPLDSVLFIQGKRIGFKHYFEKWKGNPKYGYYTISL